MPQNRRIRMPSVGDVVQSTQGRDRYRVFVVTGIDSGDKVSPVVISDGRLHKTGDKKHKNPRHLRIIASCDKTNKNSDMDLLNDVQVYEVCKKCDIFGKK